MEYGTTNPLTILLQRNGFSRECAERQIRIAFNPLTREFAVWTEAYERNPEWISGISAVFEADANHDVPKFR